MFRRKEPKRRLMDTADFPFAPDLRRGDKPDAWFRSEKHLAWIRLQPCAATGLPPTEADPVEAAHVRVGTDGVAAEKPSDIFVVPLRWREHRRQHATSEKAYWRDRGEHEPRLLGIHYALRSPCPKTLEAARNYQQFGDWRGAPADSGLLAARR